MTVRKSRNGTVRSIFLTSENSDYCQSVLELFQSSIGKPREEIEKSIKVLELKIQNPKIIRGLALIMFRISKLSPPAYLNPELVRMAIFRHAAVPPVSTEQRDEILNKVAVELNSTAEEVINSMYADKENEQILTSIPEISYDDLSKKFNQDQIETVILKSSSITVRINNNFNKIIRKIRSLGLLYTDLQEDSSGYKIIITGPLSVNEHSDRYGSKFALFVRFILRLPDWELNAKVTLKNADKKMEYLYHLDNSVLDYIDTKELKSDSISHLNFNLNPEPLKMNDNSIFPDYTLKIGSSDVNILVTRPRYYEEDLTLVNSIRKAGFEAELFCILDSGEKCPKGAQCMKNEFNFNDVNELLSKRYNRSVEIKKIQKYKSELHVSPKVEKPVINEAILKHLNDLFPDSEAMVDYLDFMGLSPAEALENAGYKIKWHGLKIEVKNK
ncbi:MAG: DUF790 family protein [Thermoplasmataceae archaeon]